VGERKFAVARYEDRGYTFEVLVDPDMALELRMGRQVGIDKVLISDTVYKDAKKGLRASEESLKRVFGTTDPRRVAEYIVKNGELPLTAEQRRKLIEQKRRQIVEWISRNCIDVRTKTPVPPQRVELALDQSGATIDPLKPVESQVSEIIKAIQRVLPIKVSVALVEVRVPPEHVHRARGAVARMGKPVKERYESDGSLVIQLEIPAGLQDSLISKVNELTHGTGEVKLISTT
jgi:ribosome maturation protein SDO1